MQCNQHRITWSEHHMMLARITAMRSPDPNTQVGACIVDQGNRVLGLGYNGLPKGMDANAIDWDRDVKPFSDSKYAYIVHAEQNAILNAHSTKLENCVLYTTLFPCNICAKEIIQTGIKKVFYLEHKYPDREEFIAAERLFKTCGVEAIKIEFGPSVWVF